ncbi:MAG: NADH-quinone oxidoreductase subunit H, partial [Desulfosalsimonadaceae bacterium]|nr:NADH-quinone oxidoreductase subunit H [Desulfosalsimonadaceae bacterium]
IAGYFTEYSGLKFVMFWMGEFLEIVTIAGIMTTMFLGAWHLPFVTDQMLLSLFHFAGPNGSNILAMLVNVGTFYVKLIFFIWLQMTIRWTLPRFRYDQVMRLGWKMILPISLINIFITGIIVLLAK